jgi:hypothetical protein
MLHHGIGKLKSLRAITHTKIDENINMFKYINISAKGRRDMITRRTPLFVAVLAMLLVGTGLLYDMARNSVESDVLPEARDEQLDDVKPFESSEDDTSFTDPNPDPGEIPRPKTISVFTIRQVFIPNQRVDIFIRNNRYVEIMGTTGGSFYWVISLRTGEVVYTSTVLWFCGKMLPHQLDHHIWNQKDESGNQVPGGSYLIVGGFSVYLDTTVIHIINSPSP